MREGVGEGLHLTFPVERFLLSPQGAAEKVQDVPPLPDSLSDAIAVSAGSIGEAASSLHRDVKSLSAELVL